jgi:two-component system, sensor histidine kinase and response regulator
VTKPRGRRGHQIRIANNGKEALTVLERTAFDVVLMDVEMPDLDGFQTTAAIRSMSDPGKAGVPIIAMTAHAMAGDRPGIPAGGCLREGRGGEEMFRAA